MGAKECISERAREKLREGNLVVSSLVPRIPSQARKRKRQISFCPRQGRGQIRKTPRTVPFLVGQGERVCACARVSVYERGAGGHPAEGMAEKRRGSPCSMLSLKAHAFSVEALIGAEKQQQLQKKRRRLGAEEAAGAADDGGCSRGGAGEKSSSEGDEGAAHPAPVGAASGPARSCADLEPSCGSRGAAGESAPSSPASFWRVLSQLPPARTAAANQN